MLSAWQNPGLCTYLQVDHRENGWCNHPPFSKAYSGRGSYIHTHAFFVFSFSFSMAAGSRTHRCIATLAHLLGLHFVLAAPQCRAPGGGFDEEHMSLTLRSLNSSDAVCNDGSPAALYYRACCDGPDPGDWCNASDTSRWLIVFGDGNADGWCWDGPSCAARAKADPSLTSSKGLPHFFTRDGEAHSDAVGAFDKSGETNPNFYPAHAAYVPHCSSDLFTGFSSPMASPAFCGRAIALAALGAIRREMESLGGPWEVVLVGGAGIFATLPELRAALPASADVSAVCDGCILLDDHDDDEEKDRDGNAAAVRATAPGAAAVTAAATATATTAATAAPGAPPATSNLRWQAECDERDAHTCPPSQTLNTAAELWNSSLPAACGGWRCLLDVVHQRMKPSTAMAAHLPDEGRHQGQLGAITRVLAQQPLYDAQTQTAHAGADPETLRSRLLTALMGADLVVASACVGPAAAFTRSAFSLVTFGAGLPPPSYASGLYLLVENQTASKLASKLVDHCVGVGCNPTCVARAVRKSKRKLTRVVLPGDVHGDNM